MHVLATQERTAADDALDAVEQVTDAFRNLVEGFLEAVPGIGIALLVFLLFVVVGRLTRGPIERRLVRARSRSFGRVFSSLIYTGILILGLFFAIPIAVPSLELAAMLGGLGLLGVAAGFAFQDILSNLLSGVLLLLRDPFRSGDQIKVNEIQGTVELITIRETQITTFDGRRVFVPNKDVYSNAIEVQTAQPYVRSSLIVGVDYEADLGRARETAMRVLQQLDGVLDEPAPQAYYTEFGASSINLDLRYWTLSRQGDLRRTQGDVVEAIKAAFDAEGINIPFDIVTLDAGQSFEDVMVRTGRATGNARRGSADDLASLTREQLYERAQEAEIEGRSSMTKSELIAALQAS